MVASPTPSKRQHRVTLRDVAAKAEVSVSTASRALTPGFSRISADVTRRVRDAAEILGYHTDYSAKATSTGSSAFVAVVASDIRDPLSAEIAHAISQVATANDLVPLIAGTGRQGEAAQQVLRQFRSVQPAAIILIESPIMDYDMSLVTKELGRYIDEDGHVAIVGDTADLGAHIALAWQAGATNLMTTLAARGYGHPTIITPAIASAAMRRWRQGLEDGATQTGIDLDVHVSSHSAIDRDGGYSTTAQLLKSRRSTDVVICASDLMAVGAMAAIKDAGLNPGEDLGVAGCGNLIMADEVLHPHLTSVDLNLARAGDQALTACLNPDPTPPPITVDHRLELRDSTPPRR